MSQMSAFVTFAVGGQRFTTSRDTLLSEPASRLALLVRGVIPAIKDDTGAVFLDRDSKHFQLVLNFLRDGWCSLPATAAERRELLQEVHWYQLPGMEAWMKAQEAAISLNQAGAAAHLPRPSSVPLDAYSRPSLFLSSGSPAPGSPLQQHLQARASSLSLSPQPGFSVTTAGPGEGLNAASYSSPAASPFRGSFLAGTNQDLLAAGALASCGILNSSSGLSSSRYTLLGAKVGTPAPACCLPASLPDSVYQAGAGATIPAAPAAALSRVPVPVAADGYKWTNRLLATNPKMQEVITTLLELAHLPPHASLHAGKVTISCSSECSHDLSLTGRTSSLLLSAQQQLEAARFRNQVIRVSSNLGWSFELAIRPASDVSLHDKYNITGFLQDNWFMVTAILKEQYGISLDEDLSARPSCLSCRRHNITLHLQKIW